jgi:outer membrane protein OmpA-like peptidoglycan-associated protein
MVSKKYKLLLFGIMCLLSSTVFAQVQPGGFDFRDSSVIPTKRQPQHNEFLNNAYAFPAKPRNQVEVGGKFGVMTISGDVPAVFPTFGWGLHVRKAFGYIFSARLEYINGTAKGLHWQSAVNYQKNRNTGNNNGWVGAGYTPLSRDNAGNLLPANVAQLNRVFYNYRTKIQDLSLQGLVTLNNLRFHKSKTGFNIYGFAGIGVSTYDTKINALNGTTRYNFNSIGDGTYKTRKDTRKALKALLDDSYETAGENQGDRRPKLFGNTMKPSGTIGFGLAIKLSKRINIALEDRHTFTKDDLMDGQRWQEHAVGDAVLTRDFDSYNFGSIGINVNLGGKSTEPLWWSNPLDYAYNEINQPKHMKLPKPILDDADGDGVTDQFDNEPNTPQGCPVDTHGVSKDTDGDGVPDCKDKELITPTQCQPVDADGVGKCPTTCCDSIMGMIERGELGKKQGSCGIGDLPSVSFTGRSVSLSNDAKAVLGGVAEKMKNNPACKVAVIGYGESNKSQQQLSWDRVNAVIKYLVEKEGISQDRFIFKYGEGAGDANTVDLQDGTDQEGPNTVPAPHPNLRRKG